MGLHISVGGMTGKRGGDSRDGERSAHIWSWKEEDEEEVTVKKVDGSLLATSISRLSFLEIAVAHVSSLFSDKHRPQGRFPSHGL